MAQQLNNRGKVRGKLGSDIYRYVKGRGYLVSIAGEGPTKEEIMTSDKFKRTREAMSEFSGVSHMMKSIKDGSKGMIREISKGNDMTTYNRLNSRLAMIKKLDEDGLKGQRSILLSLHSEFLNNFDINKNEPLNRIWTGSYGVENGADKVSATLTVGAVKPDDVIMDRPYGVTHVSWKMALLSISDWAYNTEAGEYTPINGTADKVGVCQESDKLPIDTLMTEDLTLTCSLGEIDMESATLLKIVGVKFYEKVGKNFYELYEIKTAQILV